MKTPEQILKNIIRQFPLYGQAFLKIQTTKGELVPFKLNIIQNIIQNILAHIRSEGRLIRVVILKARREGISTYVAGRYFWRVSTTPHRYAMMITHEPDATNFIFNMQKRFLAHIPKEIRPQEKYNNLKIIEFNNDRGTGLDSAIRVGSAGKEDFGSSQLVHYLHCSELSKWDKNIASNLMLSVLQTVPDEPFTEVFIESTAKGVGGEFYSRYWKARYVYTIYLDENREPKFSCKINPDSSPDNTYSSIFIPFFVFPEYTRTVPPEFKRTKEEEELVKLYNLSDAQLSWRRWAIENKCGGDVTLFQQEYPANPAEAFITTGSSVFDNNKLTALKSTLKPPIAKYTIELSNKQVMPDKDPDYVVTNKLLVWEEARRGEQYVIGCDVSEGLAEGDFSSIDVVNIMTGRQCAHWHGKIGPDLLAIILFVLGHRYNHAIIAPERNNQGLTTITKLLEFNYKNLYVEKAAEAPHRTRKRYGWLSSRGAKRMMIDNLIAELRDDTIGISYTETINEMLTFKQSPDGTLGGEVGMHDDRVISFAIAKYIASKQPLRKKKIKEEFPDFSSIGSLESSHTNSIIIPTNAYL